jgi:hypothetical protein
MNNKSTTKFEQMKEKFAREACLTIDLILIRNQSTYIETEKPKINNKIIQHEKTNPSLNSPSTFPLSNPFFAQTVAIMIVITIPPGDLQSDTCGLPSPPPQTPRSKGSGSGNSS